jgi:hypothetical protein
VRRDRHDRPLSLFSHMLIQSRPSRGMFQDWLAVSVLWIAAVGTLTTWGATDCWRQQNEWVVVEPAEPYPKPGAPVPVDAKPTLSDCGCAAQIFGSGAAWTLAPPLALLALASQSRASPVGSPPQRANYSRLESGLITPRLDLAATLCGRLETREADARRPGSHFLRVGRLANLVALRTPSGRPTRDMTCASQPRSRAVTRPDAVQLADETARKPQKPRSGGVPRAGSPNCAQARGGRIDAPRLPGEDAFFLKSKPKLIASVPQISDDGVTCL